MRAVRTVLMAVAMGCGAVLSQARAAPPTVTPSPGYDARLQEERAALASQPPSYYGQPPQAPVRRHPRRSHHEAR